MHKFKLVTDSTIDQSADYFTRHQIDYIPLSFTIDGKTYPEDCGQTVSFTEFYTMLQEGKKSVTSQATPDSFLGVFRAALKQGLDVLYVGFSSGLSGTYQSGCIARDELKDEFPDRQIICIDSLSATGGEAILVEKAREMRDNGCTLAETAEALEQMRLHIIHLITVDDLEHLHRGGRVSRTSAIVGGLLGIKPMLYMDNNGKLAVCGKVRGRQKAIEQLATQTINDIADKSQIVRIGHGKCYEDAKVLSSLLLDAGIVSEIYDVGTVIGSHTGAGVLLCFYVGSERKPF